MRRAGIATIIVLSLVHTGWGLTTREEIYNGRVVHTGTAELMVQIEPDNDHKMFTVAPDTKIMRNGMSASLDGLQADDHVTVTARTSDGQPTAILIVARSPYFLPPEVGAH